jgi:hypothetical protein
MPANQPRVMRTIRALAAYAAGGGRFDVILPDTAQDGIDIGPAVRALQARRRAGRLSAATAEHLAAIPGWSWDPPKDHRRKGEAAATIRALKSFAEGGGNCGRIPPDLVIDSVRVSRAASDLRARYHRGELTSAATRALESLRGWIWRAGPGDSPQSPEYGRAAGRRPHSEVFRLLEQFAERYGHTWVPRYHVADGFRLGSWVSLQRRLHRRGRVPTARAQRLEALPGWTWDPTTDRAGAKRQLATPAGTLLALRQHVASGGKFPIDAATVWRGMPLLPTLNEVRRLHALGLLPLRLVRGFDALEGWDWMPADRVGICLTALRGFVAREGHSCVPRSHREGELALGRWVAKVRERYRAGSLAPALAKSLASLPGWRWSFRAGATGTNPSGTSDGSGGEPDDLLAAA